MGGEMGRGATRQSAPRPVAPSGGCRYLCVIATLFVGGSRGPSVTRRRVTAEALCLARPQVDDLALAQLQFLKLGPGQLCPDLGAVAECKLDPDLKTKRDDPLDH